MKIAIPTNDGIYLAEKTGHARGFMIYHIKKGGIKRKVHILLPQHLNHDHNQNGKEKNGHHSHKELIEFLSANDLIIVKRIGPHLKQDFLNQGLPFQIVNKKFLDEVIEEYLQQEILI
jgi:predicted Fe-Mo cluster-binding NifX family protein